VRRWHVAINALVYLSLQRQSNAFPTTVGVANEMSAPTRLFCHIFRRVPSSHDEQIRKDRMTHEHDFVKDLDGQVTCSICGAMDDEKDMG